MEGLIHWWGRAFMVQSLSRSLPLSIVTFGNKSSTQEPLWDIPTLNHNNGAVSIWFRSHRKKEWVGVGWVLWIVYATQSFISLFPSETQRFGKTGQSCFRAQMKLWREKKMPQNTSLFLAIPPLIPSPCPESALIAISRQMASHYYRTIAVLVAGHIMMGTGLSWHIITHSLLLMLIFWDRRIHCLAIAGDASNPKGRKVSAFRQTHPMVIDGVLTSYKMQQKLGKRRAQCDLQGY